jgi:hypothetical protein
VKQIHQKDEERRWKLQDVRIDRVSMPRICEYPIFLFTASYKIKMFKI